MPTNRGKFERRKRFASPRLGEAGQRCYPERAAQSRYYQHADGLSDSVARKQWSAITRRTITGARTARRKRNANC